MTLSMPSDWLRVWRDRCRWPTFVDLAAFAAIDSNDSKNNEPPTMLQTLDHEVDGDYFHQFDRIVIGSAGGSNLIRNPAGFLWGTRSPRWLMQKFRDRFWKAYGIRRSVSTSPKNPRILAPTNDKRYRPEDWDVILKLKSEYNYSQLQVLRWEDHQDFREQLQLCADTDIYLTAPGSSMLNAPFLADGAVVINLGCWSYWGGQPVPRFMEQQIVGGSTPYLRVLFRNFANDSFAFRARPAKIPGYSEQEAAANLVLEDVLQLVKQAQKLLSQRVTFRQEDAVLEDNLSLEARAWHDICTKDLSRCKQIFRALNYGACAGGGQIWVEALIYQIWTIPDCRIDDQTAREVRYRYRLPDYINLE